MTKEISFLSKFREEERIKLLSFATYASYKAGDVIFHEGDEGDRMYIILKGSVSVRIKNSSLGEQSTVISTKRDGDYFGELALISSDPKKEARNKRRASCICDEDSQFLVLPIKEVQEVISNLIHTTFAEDIKIMNKTPHWKV